MARRELKAAASTDDVWYRAYGVTAVRPLTAAARNAGNYEGSQIEVVLTWKPKNISKSKAVMRTSSPAIISTTSARMTRRFRLRAGDDLILAACGKTRPAHGVMRTILSAPLTGGQDCSRYSAAQPFFNRLPGGFLLATRGDPLAARFLSRATCLIHGGQKGTPLALALPPMHPLPGGVRRSNVARENLAGGAPALRKAPRIKPRARA